MLTAAQLDREEGFSWNEWKWICFANKEIQLDHRGGATVSGILQRVNVCVTKRTVGPGLMDFRLLVELLGQMLQSLQTSDLAEDPLLVALLCSLQSVPRSVDVLRAKRSCYTLPSLQSTSCTSV